MTENNFNPTTCIDQDNIVNLNKPDFDIEDGFCRRLNKIKGIAELFHYLNAESRPVISVESFSGISHILEDTTEELRAICYKLLEGEGVPNDNEIRFHNG